MLIVVTNVVDGRDIVVSMLILVGNATENGTNDDTVEPVMTFEGITTGGYPANVGGGCS